jgi:hypothetical protein
MSRQFRIQDIFNWVRRRTNNPTVLEPQYGRQRYLSGVIVCEIGTSRFGSSGILDLGNVGMIFRSVASPGSQIATLFHLRKSVALVALIWH